MVYRPRNRLWTPAALPAAAVTLADLRAHLRVDHVDEDDLIGKIALAATEAVEKWTQRLLVQRQAVLRLPCLPVGLEPVELPGGVVTSVTSVVADGATVTGATAFGDSPAQLVPAAAWPVVTGDGFPVVITYQVGLTAVPEDLRAAVKMIASDLYERRGQSSAQAANLAAINAEWLMARHRIMAL